MVLNPRQKQKLFYQLYLAQCFETEILFLLPPSGPRALLPPTFKFHSVNISLNVSTNSKTLTFSRHFKSGLGNYSIYFHLGSKYTQLSLNFNLTGHNTPYIRHESTITLLYLQHFSHFIFKSIIREQPHLLPPSVCCCVEVEVDIRLPGRRQIGEHHQ